MHDIAREPRIIAVGFHDDNGNWVSTWERALFRRLSVEWTGEELKIKYVRPGKEPGTMPLVDFLEDGLPKKEVF